MTQILKNTGHGSREQLYSIRHLTKWPLKPWMIFICQPRATEALGLVEERVVRKARTIWERRRTGKASGSIFNPSFNVWCLWMGFGGVIPSQPETHLNPQLSLRAPFSRFNHRFSPDATAHRPLLGCTAAELQLCGSDVTQEAETVESGSHSAIYRSIFILLCFTRETNSWCHHGDLWRIVCCEMSSFSWFH